MNSPKRKAAIWGTSVGYTDTGSSVVIETNDGRIIVITNETFEYLYYKLDDFTAALKEDCIEYAVCDTTSPECVILTNFLGMTKHMDLNTFDQYYDTVGGILE